MEAIKYLEKLGDELVAESNNPHDRYHIGKLIIKQLSEHPYDIHQIDAATDEQETNGSILERSIATAHAITSQGLQVGDVALLMSTNNMDATVPFLACLYVGVIPMAVDHTITEKDILRKFLEIGKPKIAFCLPEKIKLVEETALELGLDITNIVTLGKNKMEGYVSLKQFMEEKGKGEQDDASYQGVSFDTTNTIALMNFSSGTTEAPKATAHTHRGYIACLPNIWCEQQIFPRPTRLILWLVPLQWMSSTFTIVAGGILLFPRVQLSAPYSKELAYKLINKYKPSFCVQTAKITERWMEYPGRLSCDFSGFESVFIGGSPVSSELMQTFQSLISGRVYNIYGLTEAGYNVLMPCSSIEQPGCCGKPLPYIEYKIVDTGTGEELGVNEPGELWLRGQCFFRKYYNNEELTKAVFAPGGWFKTGDLFYKNEHDYYYFVDRIKCLMIFRTYKIYPTEIEQTILKHPSVLDVAVCGYYHTEDGDLPTAFVVRKNESHVTASEIEDWVRDRLGDEKQLRGGVIFLEKIPLTATSKVNRVELNKLLNVRIGASSSRSL